MSGFWLIALAGLDGWVGCFRRFEWMASFSLRNSDSFLALFVQTRASLETWHIMGEGRKEMNCNWDNGTLESDGTTTWERPGRWTLGLWHLFLYL